MAAAAVVLALIAAGLGGYLLGMRDEAGKRAQLPVLGAAPSFTLVNQLGDRVSSASFAGKVRLVTFLFPYCTTFCPLIAAHLSNLETLGLRPAGLANKVEILSFNVDPANTGPAEMRAFLSQYGWDPRNPHWQYLTGAPKDIRRVVTDGFHISYQQVSAASADGAGPPVAQPEVENALAKRAHAGYDISHNDALEIVDVRGRIRKIYDEADAVSRDELMGTIRAVLRSGAASP